MFAKERQNIINDMVNKEGAVTVSALANFFKVSDETIRRDLVAMEKNNLLARVHGGALKVDDMKEYLSFNQRTEKNSMQKNELAMKAVEFIENGQIIAIDAGSTAMALANAIKRKFTDLTVITYSLDVFNILHDCEGITVILSGGEYLKSENALCGTIALETLKNFHVQKSFVCPSAVSIELGICDYQKGSFDIQKQLIAFADKVFILADSSKFEKKALFKLENMRKDFKYITDSRLSDELHRLYENNDIKIYK